LGQLNIDISQLAENEKQDKWFPVEKGEGEIRLSMMICPVSRFRKKKKNSHFEITGWRDTDDY